MLRRADLRAAVGWEGCTRPGLISGLVEKTEPGFGFRLFFVRTARLRYDRETRFAFPVFAFYLPWPKNLGSIPAGYILASGLKLLAGPLAGALHSRTATGKRNVV